jgi:iron(III) transport system substrate-binding protein
MAQISSGSGSGRTMSTSVSSSGRDRTFIGLLEPLTATNNSIGLAKNAPHPNAAMLFLDFVLSKKGQRVFQAVNYLPAHPEVAALQADLKPGIRFKKANYLSPDVLLDKGNEWSDYFDKEFLR